MPVSSASSPQAGGTLSSPVALLTEENAWDGSPLCQAFDLLVERLSGTPAQFGSRRPPVSP
jgi:hypothetical protein